MPNETTEAAALTAEQEDMMAVELVLLKADRFAHRWERLPEWFLRKLKESDAVGEAIKANYKGMMAELVMRRRAFILEWGPEFRQTGEADLATVNAGTKGKPRKTMRYLTGQAGTQKSQDRLVVQDAKLAAKWAWEHTRSACDIVLARSGPLLDYIKASRKVVKETGEESYSAIPGCVFVEGHDAPTPKLEPLDGLPDLPPPTRRPELTTETTDEPDDSLGDFMTPQLSEQPF